MSSETVTYSDWIRDKIAVITEAYQKGEGYGDIFESQYLVYLECLIASRGLDPTKMWDDWRSRIRDLFDLKKKDPVLAMNRYLTGDNRAKLIEELEAFKRKWSDGPSPRQNKIVTEDLVAPKTKDDSDKDGPPKLGTGRPEGSKKTSKKKPTPDKDEGIFGLFGDG